MSTMNFAGRALGALLLSLVMHFPLSAFAQSAPVSVEAFFQNPSFSGAELSPDGRNVAVKVAAKGGRVKLAVVDLATLTPKVVADFADADVGRFLWVNKDRLVFDLHDQQLAVGNVRLWPGLFAVNRDGGNFKVLVNRGAGSVNREPLRADTFLLQGNRFYESDDVFVVQPQLNAMRNEVVAINLLRLDTVTGRATMVDRPGNTFYWVIDHTGTPRFAETWDQNIRRVYYRDSAAAPWKQVLEEDRYSFKGWTPYMFGPDGTAYVRTLGGRDKYAVYRYDPKNNRLDGEPFVAIDGYDFNGQFMANRQKIVGVQYESDAVGTLWLDDSMKKLQKAVDDLLLGTVNLVSSAIRSETPYLLVRSFSDVQPSVTRLYNKETGKLTLLGQAHPDIDAKRMASMDMIRYKARDGMEIPAYLTLPKGGAKKNLPLVVLVHGGPWVRGGHWQWDGQVQFLASRGYAVLQPEFRGSIGYGDKHFRAGWKQWGLAMQDDVADGAKWAISQGIADPKRICIAGASYGGYSTLMGLAKDADLFKCGINWVGVTDIDLMYSVNWSDLGDEYKRFGMPILVGDREKDAAQLKTTSPIQNAARIKQPLLMAYGGVDFRVPIVHGTKFRDAVTAHNPDIEWVVYPDEGHRWGLVSTRVDFWTRVERFLERQLRKP